MPAIPLASMILLACPELVDPMEDERTALAALDVVPMPVGWTPSATVIISDAQVQKLVTRFATALSVARPAQLSVGGPIGITAKVKPDAPHVALSVSPTCVECVALDGWGTGVLSLDAGGYSGDVRWRSEVEATVRVEGAPGPEGFRVSIVPVERESWTIGLDVHGLNVPFYGALIEAALERQIEVGIKEAGPLAGAVPIATLPADGPVRLRGLSTRYTDALDIGLGFSALTSGTVRDHPDPGGGFAVVLPADTLLGLAQAAILRHGPVNGYEPEATTLHLDDGKFELWLKIWKIARKEKWREYVIRGTIGLEGGVLSVKTQDAVETGKEEWGTPLDPLIQAVVVEMLKKTLAVETPGRYVHTLGDSGAIAVTMTRVQADADVLTLWGTVD